MEIVIKSFACKKTQYLFETGKATGFLGSIQKQAKRRLAIVHFATVLADLKVPPGNRLELLSGDRKGQYSVRINDRYRLCFRFINGNAEDVEIVDYHK